MANAEKPKGLQNYRINGKPRSALPATPTKAVRPIKNGLTNELMDRLAKVLIDLSCASVEMVWEEKARAVRVAMQCRQADAALEELLSYFDLEKDVEGGEV